MSTEVISPLPNQSVIRTGEHDGHRRHDDDRVDWAILREQASGFRGAAQDRLSLGQDIGTGFTAGALASCKTDDAICGASSKSDTNFAMTQKQVSDAATATVVGFKDSLAIAYQVEGRSLLEAAKNANAASVQATMFANASSVQATANYNALSIEMVKNASAAELRAQQIAATAAAQAAECCCELKALIVSDGNATRALINNNTIQSLRDQLLATQRIVPVTIPVGA